MSSDVTFPRDFSKLYNENSERKDEKKKEKLSRTTGCSKLILFKGSGCNIFFFNSNHYSEHSGKYILFID